jgi:hypothetical protein
MMGTLALIAVVSGQLRGVLIGALIIAILILAVAGLLYLVERFISPVPAIAKLILALLILACIVIWAFSEMGTPL